MKKDNSILAVFLLSLFLFSSLAVSAGPVGKEANPAKEPLALQSLFPVEFKNILRDKDGVVARAEDEKGQLWAFLPSFENPTSLTGFSIQPGRTVKKMYISWAQILGNIEAVLCMQENGEEKCYGVSEEELNKAMQKTYFSKKGLMPPALIRNFAKEQKALSKAQKQEQAYMRCLGEEPVEKCDEQYSSFSVEDKDYIKYRVWCSPWILMEDVSRCESHLSVVLKKYPDNVYYPSMAKCVKGIKKGTEKEYCMPQWFY